jgi:hypothetical protein
VPQEIAHKERVGAGLTGIRADCVPQIMLSTLPQLEWLKQDRFACLIATGSFQPMDGDFSVSSRMMASRAFLLFL